MRCILFLSLHPTYAPRRTNDINTPGRPNKIKEGRKYLGTKMKIKNVKKENNTPKHKPKVKGKHQEKITPLIQKFSG